MVKINYLLGITVSHTLHSFSTVAIKKMHPISKILQLIFYSDRTLKKIYYTILLFIYTPFIVLNNIILYVTVNEMLKMLRIIMYMN